MDRNLLVIALAAIAFGFCNRTSPEALAEKVGEAPRLTRITLTVHTVDGVPPQDSKLGVYIGYGEATLGNSDDLAKGQALLSTTDLTYEVPIDYGDVAPEYLREGANLCLLVSQFSASHPWQVDVSVHYYYSDGTELFGTAKGIKLDSRQLSYCKDLISTSGEVEAVPPQAKSTTAFDPGYSITGRKVTFNYDPATYAFEKVVSSVVVAGTFNGWSTNSGAWRASDDDRDGRWTLTADRSVVTCGSQFKFVVNGTSWQQPGNSWPPDQIVDDGHGGFNIVVVCK